MKLPPLREVKPPAIVNAGPDSPVGHAAPGDFVTASGQLLHMDFGVKHDDYCADLQRTWYVLREGESAAPSEVRQGFGTIVRAIEEPRRAIRPGALGKDVDQVARRIDESLAREGARYASTHGATYQQEGVAERTEVPAISGSSDLRSYLAGRTVGLDSSRLQIDVSWTAPAGVRCSWPRWPPASINGA